MLTTGSDRPIGFTATSLVALSVDPPMLSFNVSRGSSSWPGFAPPTDWRTGPYDVPLLDDVLAWMVCRIETRVEATRS